jgi:hypothetical protein
MYDRAASAHGAEAGLRMMITAMLVAPEFLYRVERGQGTPLPDGRVALSPYEVATRLSYLTLGTAPDDALLAASANGELSTPAGVANTALKLFDQAATDGTLVPFYQRWLQVGSRAELRSVFETPEAANAAVNTFGEFVSSWMQDPNGSFLKLFTTPIPRVDIGGNLGQMNAGILAIPAVVASHTTNPDLAPIFRGKFALEALLCHQIPPPPAMVAVAAPNPGVSVREKLMAHRTNPSCAGCHDMLDPAGFPFEQLDAIGRYVPDADATGTLPSVGEVRSLEELGEKLAVSPQAQECFAQYWLTYAFAVRGSDFDPCVRQALASELPNSPNAARALLTQTVQLPEFLMLVKEKL